MRGLNKPSLGPAAMLGCLFALMFFLNFRTGMVADDFMFSFSRASWERVTDVPDILRSLAVLRRDVNGRVFSHFFAMLFLLLPKGWFNLVNAAFSTLLFYIIYRYVKTGDGRRDSLLLSFVLGTVWLLLPAFGQVFLWLTGACNYSWTMLVSLVYLLPFWRRYRGQAELPASKPLRALYLILAFLAGAWSENGALAVLFAAFCFLALSALRERRLPGFLTAALWVGGCGFLFLMLSPSELGGRRGDPGESTLTKAIRALTGQLSPALLLAAGAAALIVLALLVLLFFKKRSLACGLSMGLLCAAVLAGTALLARGDLAGKALLPGIGALLSDTKLSLLLAFWLYGFLLLLGLMRRCDGRTLLAALILGLSAFGSLAVFFFALYFPARSACPAIFYTTLADALLLSALWNEGRRRPLKILSALAALLFVCVLPLAMRDVAHTGELLAQRRELLTELGRQRPGDIVTVEPVTPLSKYAACWPGDENYFIIEMGRYYGLGQVNVTEYVNTDG